MLKNGFYSALSAIAALLTPVARKQSYDLLMPWSVRGMTLIAMVFLATVLMLLYIYRPY